MSQFYEIKKTLEDCGSADSATRKNGESEIKKMRDEDPRKFLISLVKELGEPANVAAVRQLAALILKNFLVNNQSSKKYDDYWINLEVPVRTDIKGRILGSLSSPESPVRQQVAQVVAAIASIEIPRKEWEELIPNLCNDVQQEGANVNQVHGSMLAIGYICEDLQPEEIDIAIKNKIVQTLVMNITTEPEKIDITKIAIRAFFYSIPYARNCFSIQADRDFIMERIIKACGLPDGDIQERGLQCLSEIGTQEYEHLDPYFIEIAKATEACSASDQDKVGAQAFEFWTSLTEHEINLKKNSSPCKDLVIKFKDSLVTLIFQGLVKADIEDGSEQDEWGHALAAACCLQAVAQILKDEIVQPVIEFVAAGLGAEDVQRRYSALMALGCIFEGPSRQRLQTIIEQALPSLFGSMTDQNPKIRESVAWVFSRISEHQAEVLCQPTVFDPFVQGMLQGFMDAPRVANQCCFAMNNMAKAQAPENEDQEANVLTPHYQTILEALFKTASRTDYHDSGIDLMHNSYGSFISFVQYSCTSSRNSNYQLLIPLLQKLEETISGDVNETVQHLQDDLCALIQAILLKVGDLVQKPMVDNIVSLIIRLFQQATSVTENGLFLMNGLANGCAENLEIHQLCQYLKHALEMKEDVVTRMACGIISDLAYGKPEQLTNYLDDYVPCLHQLLKESSLERSIKVHAIRALADLALNCGVDFKREFLVWSFDALNMAAKASVTHEIPANDEDTKAFLLELKDEILKSYSNFIIAAQDSKALDLVIAHLDTIYSYIKLIVTGNAHEVDLTKSAIALIGDIVEAIPKENDVVKTRSFEGHIEQGIFALQRSADPDCRQIAASTLQTIQNLQKSIQQQ